MTIALPTSPSVYQTRDGLVAHVIDTLDGQVTEDQVKFMIGLAEARFNRLINAPEREIQATTTVTGDISLPNDCWALRSIYVDTDPTYVLDQMSPSALKKQYAGYPGGQPRSFALVGNALVFGPQLDGAYDIVIAYQQTIPSLSDETTSNWLLVEHPDVYLYGTLVQCEAFIANDERVGLWKAALDECIGEIIDSSARRRAFASPIRLRTGVAV